MAQNEKLRESRGMFQSSTAPIIISDWKGKMGVVAVLIAGVFVFHWLTCAEHHSEASTEPITVGRIPLSESKLDQWVYAARILAVLRTNHKIYVPAGNLRELIEWGCKNPDVLESVPWLTKPQAFLGLALSIENARANLQQLEDYKLLLEEPYRLSAQSEEVAERLNFPNPPEIEAWEQKDLEAYNLQAAQVEQALEELLPPPTPVFLSWGEEGGEFSQEESGKKEGPTSRYAQWRVVSGSRTGPSVLRKNPSQQNHSNILDELRLESLRKEK